MSEEQFWVKYYQTLYYRRQQENAISTISTQKDDIFREVEDAHDKEMAGMSFSLFWSCDLFGANAENDNSSEPFLFKRKLKHLDLSVDVSANELHNPQQGYGVMLVDLFVFSTLLIDSDQKQKNETIQNRKIRQINFRKHFRCFGDLIDMVQQCWGLYMRN